MGAPPGQSAPRSSGAQQAPLVVVSPHLDDGVFGCGELLACHPGSVSITVFAGRPPGYEPMTEWDVASGFRPGDDVIALRRREDRAALALLSARPLWVEFLDGQYGHTPTVDRAAEALEAAIAALEPAAVYVPLGLFHSDHKLTHAAAQAVMRRRSDLDWLAYEDAMYRRINGLLDERLAELRDSRIRVEPAGGSTGQRLELKRNAVQQYASQLRALTTPGRLGYLDAFRPERYWRLAWDGRGNA